MSFYRPLSQSINRSLRIKITLSVVFPLVIILGIFSTIEYIRSKEAVLNNLSFLASQVAQVIENSLQHEMLSQNLEGIQQMLDSIAQSESMRVVNLMDMSGEIIFAPESKDVGIRLDNRDPTCQPCHKLPAAERPSSVVITLNHGERVFRSMNPIENRPACQECHDPSQRLIGMLLTDISMNQIEESFTADLQIKVLWGVLTIFVTIVVVNLILSKMVMQRFERLAQTMVHFGQGQKDLRLPTGDGDEIDVLANAFNEMGQRIEIEETENLALTELLRNQSEQRGVLLNRLITAQEDERKRVARELHDDLGQSLAGLALQVEATEHSIVSDPDRALDQLKQIRKLINETVNRMYDLIMDLRPSELDDLGLVVALQAHAKRIFANTKTDFELNAKQLNERLPPEIEVALYRIFQEALTNIIRHANAQHVHIILTRNNGVFKGEIIDDGKGFDPQDFQANANSTSEFGLLGMQERVSQCGGNLEIISKPGDGTHIRISVPIINFEKGKK